MEWIASRSRRRQRAKGKPGSRWLTPFFSCGLILSRCPGDEIQTTVSNLPSQPYRPELSSQWLHQNKVICSRIYLYSIEKNYKIHGLSNLNEGQTVPSIPVHFLEIICSPFSPSTINHRSFLRFGVCHISWSASFQQPHVMLIPATQATNVSASFNWLHCCFFTTR